MKNKMQDVRNHIVAMLEALGDDLVDQEVIARAKVTAELAHAYTATVKVELDAIRLAGLDTLPSVIDSPREISGSGRP